MLLFVTSICVPLRLGMAHMPPRAIINTALDWMAMFVLAILYNDCKHGRTLSNTGYFRMLLLVFYLCVFFEVGIWVFDGLASCRVLSYVCNIGSNSTILVGTYLYYGFVRSSGEIDPDVMPWMRRFLCAVMVGGIAAELLNCVGGYFYIVDEAGVYIRSAHGSALGYIPFVLILGGVTLFLVRQPLVWQTKLKYLSYGILPFVASLWYTFTGLPPTFLVATAMSLLLVHSSIYVAQSRKAEFYELQNAKTEAENALNRNMLMLSQIRPHFIYNVLGGIEVLCSLDPQKAGRAIHHFTQYLRGNMDIINNEETIPFARELEHIRNYIWLEQMRFEDELEYEEQIETMDFRVPQLAVQPMVENAVKHGMMGSADGVLRVTLKTQQTDTEHIVTVQDDGCGFDPAHLPEDGRSHLGIRSAAYNLRLCVGGTLEIKSRIGAGTTVTIRIPKGGKKA